MLRLPSRPKDRAAEPVGGISGDQCWGVGAIEFAMTKSSISDITAVTAF